MAEIRKKSFNRRIAIALLGLYCIARGIAYLPMFSVFDRTPRGIELVSGIIPLDFWAGAWVVVGVVAIVKAIIGKDGIAIPLSCGMMMAWGTAFLYGWLENILMNGETSNDWFSASTYILLSLVIAILSAKGGEEVEFVAERN